MSYPLVALWKPDQHLRRQPFLHARARLMGAVRTFFASRDFLEVETAALQVSPGNETHLHAFETGLRFPGFETCPLYLRTSPEFACKKLLAAGEPRIMELARVFRNGERTKLHHPEFTLLEWYRAEETYDVLMRDCEALLGSCADAVGAKTMRYGDRSANPFAGLQHLTLAEAFDRFTRIDLLSTVAPDGTTDAPRFAALAREASIRVAADDTWNDVFTRVLADRIEPFLGEGRATVLYEYPLSQAALARPKAEDPRVAERFELYACGVELANAFGELNDAAEQRRRFERDMDEKERLYGERYPLDESFLEALSIMPDASGAALGFDRLVMLMTGARHIEDVIWTPLFTQHHRAS